MGSISMNDAHRFMRQASGKADYTNYTLINEAAAARKGTVVLDSDGEDEEAESSDGIRVIFF